MKFKIGDTIYWVESGAHYEKLIPCPMCFGQRKVDLILGNGEKISSECGCCEVGQRATGTAKTWEPSAEIRSGTITGVSTRDGIKYEVGHRSVEENEAFASEKDAEPHREPKLTEATKNAEMWAKDNFVHATKKQIWSAGYHRSCIKRAEKTIEWHRMRLAMVKEANK